MTLRRKVLAAGMAVAALSVLFGPLGDRRSGQAASAEVPTFGRPAIVGIQAGGNSEPFLRIDTHGRRYVTVPYGSRTLIWRSSDGGQTFKWVPGAAPKTGSLPTWSPTWACRRTRSCPARTGRCSPIFTPVARSRWHRSKCWKPFSEVTRSRRFGLARLRALSLGTGARAVTCPPPTPRLLPRARHGEATR